MTIRTALMQRIQAAGFTQPISWPGVNFTRPTTGPWLEVRLFENKPIQLGLSNDSAVMERGYLQISVCARSGEGFTTIGNVALQVMAAFKKGTPVIRQIRVSQDAYKGAERIAPDYLFIPVIIEYGA